MTKEVWCAELRIADVSESMVADLNELLKELSEDSSQLNLYAVRAMLASGTRMFGAVHDSHVVG